MKKTFIFGLLATVLGFSSCSNDNDMSDIPVAGITLNVSTAELTIGGDEADATTTLIATVAPENATNKAIAWSSSNTDVATVSPEGVVKAVSEGTTTITATVKDGSGKTATCTVTVVKAALATTGTAKRTGDIDVNWVQLWENGPKFAEYNVGVTDGKAESYGGYYCWGSNIDKDARAAYKGGTDALTGTDDTVTNLWGSNWRMPTKAEIDALLANCDVVWTTVNGVKGIVFTGQGDYASNSVFLPAAGDCSLGRVFDQGDYGYYWSSTPCGSYEAYDLDFLSGDQDMYDRSRSRGHGYSVRAVLSEE